MRNKKEYREIVEKFIKRKLKESETIHHINFNPKDNRIENLMIFKNNSEHIKFHRKIDQFGLTTPTALKILNRWDNL